MLLRIIGVVALACLIFFLDQESKKIAIEILRQTHAPHLETAAFIPFLQQHPVPPYQLMPMVNIVYAENKGINFGLFASEAAFQPYIFAVLSIGISLFLFIWSIRTNSWCLRLGAAILIGGALGNAWDRLMTNSKAVIDFINMDCCGIGNPYAFNGADMAIFGGVALIFIALWREVPPQAKD